MKIIVKVSDEAIEQALDGAMGAIRYWGTAYRHGQSTRIYENDVDLGDGTRRPGGKFVLGRTQLEAGLTRMAAGSPRLFAKMLEGAEHVDDNVADVFVQYCCFGEVRYG